MPDGPLRYAAYHRLGGEPNVVVDGSPTEATVLTLSHWPKTPCPAGLEGDLSAQMAFAYLDRLNRTDPTDLHGEARLVSNNHFDQDGLVSVFALISPREALARRDLLIDLAGAGDFATYTSRTAARISMTVSAFADPDRSPIGPAPGDYNDWTALLYEEVPGRLADICDHPDTYRELWAEEDAELSAAEAAIASGAVRIEEEPHLDLTIVTAGDDAPRNGGHRFGGQRVTGLHPMAVHNATARLATLFVTGQHYEFCYRYESWVQYRSRLPRPRVDLTPLADELTELEPHGRWVFDGVGALTPRLRLEGADASTMAPADFRSRLTGYMAHAAPAWDPYARAQP